MSKKHLQPVMKVLDKKKIKYNFDEGKIYIGNRTSDREEDMYGQMVAYQHGNIMYMTTSFMNVPEESRDEVLKIINDRNFQIVNGSYEMDASDGQLRFRSTMYIKGSDMDGKSYLYHTMLGFHMMQEMMSKIGPLMSCAGDVRSEPMFG